MNFSFIGTYPLRFNELMRSVAFGIDFVIIESTFFFLRRNIGIAVESTF